MIKDELTYSIIGFSIKVHNTLGNGFQKVISPLFDCRSGFYLQTSDFLSKQNLFS